MAQITKLIDDLDGSEDDVQTVRFALSGKAYELDLSAANRQLLEDALQPFVSVARTPGSAYAKVAGATTRRSPSTSSSGAPKPDYDADAFREWAKANGTLHRGRPSADEIHAFLESQSRDTQPNDAQSRDDW
ncbi:MAG: histone-like nucleoid-structuring protein Lsr2 [Ilumatobacteraceae bacterium]